MAVEAAELGRLLRLLPNHSSLSRSSSAQRFGRSWLLETCSSASPLLSSSQPSSSHSQGSREPASLAQQTGSSGEPGRFGEDQGPSYSTRQRSEGGLRQRSEAWLSTLASLISRLTSLACRTTSPMSLPSDEARLLHTELARLHWSWPSGSPLHMKRADDGRSFADLTSSSSTARLSFSSLPRSASSIPSPCRRSARACLLKGRVGGGKVVLVRTWRARGFAT